MPECVSRRNLSGFLDKTQLLKIKLRAIRAGVWYRALRRIDRVLVDLTLRVAANVRSPSLARSIQSITEKLEDVLESRLARTIREIGYSLASKLSVLAQKWGHREAWRWAGDQGFARYLAVLRLNG